METRKSTDFLVMGSGIAGLSFALKAAPYGKVIVVTKVKAEETNTRYAQGGIAAVTYMPDTFKKHVSDTIEAGGGLCKEDIVNMVITEAPRQIEELVHWGAEFDRLPDGNFDLAKEGGHSEKRILHHKDNTGFEIQRALLQQVKQNPNIELLEYHFAIEIITQHHLGIEVKRYTSDIECFGAYVFNVRKNSVDCILSKVTYIATGGIGNIYLTTTNPSIATGDGIAMVYRAKGQIENMEFIQFHPTSFYDPGKRPSFLITEALRGFGAILKTTDNNEFMHKYDKRGCLAPRDIVARAIDNEMKLRGDDFVYLDCTHLNKEQLKIRFPNIRDFCMKAGYDISKDLIPVIPAAHYLCGGIKVDIDGCSSIKNLYAGGESASTGIHGANRLASNSLLEAIVFAHRSAIHAAKNIQNISINNNIPSWNDEGTTHPEELMLITQNFKELQQIMSNYVSIVRSNLRLRRALDRLEIIYRETEELFKKSTISTRLCELRNGINIGYLIIILAQKRKESRGLHFNIDYPYKNPD